MPDPKDKIHLFTQVARAQGALAVSDFESVAEILRVVLEEDPRIVSAQLTYGNALFRQGDYAGAAVAFEATLELNPDEDMALLNLGIAHRRLGAVDTARAELAEVLQRDPLNASAHFNLGEIALEANDPLAARQHFESAAEINDGLPGPIFGLGVAAFQLDQIDRATAEFERVVALGSLFPEIYYYQALIAERHGDVVAAAELYRNEVAHNPGHHRSWINLSQIYAAGGDPAAAVEALRSAITMRPDVAPAHILLARSLLALEDATLYAEVEAAARRGLELDPPAEIRPLAHYVLADVYNRLGQPEAVQRELAFAREAERRIGQ